VAHLVAAAETRDVIGMAKGMIMARSRCGPAAAFDALRRASMRENVKLRVIASRMVAAAEVADGSASGDALLATT
jgi:AmiR/NasT family two-component response regulator